MTKSEFFVKLNAIIAKHPMIANIRFISFT